MIQGINGKVIGTAVTLLMGATAGSAMAQSWPLAGGQGTPLSTAYYGDNYGGLVPYGGYGGHGGYAGPAGGYGGQGVVITTGGQQYGHGGFGGYGGYGGYGRQAVFYSGYQDHGYSQQFVPVYARAAKDAPRHSDLLSRHVTPGAAYGGAGTGMPLFVIRGR